MLFRFVVNLPGEDGDNYAQAVKVYVSHLSRKEEKIAFISLPYRKSGQKVNSRYRTC